MSREFYIIFLYVLMVKYIVNFVVLFTNFSFVLLYLFIVHLQTTTLNSELFWSSKLGGETANFVLIHWFAKKLLSFIFPHNNTSTTMVRPKLQNNKFSSASYYIEHATWTCDKLAQNHVDKKRNCWDFSCTCIQEILKSTAVYVRH